jgi:hypothetical protein
MLDRVIIDLTDTTATFSQVDSFIRDLNLMGKWIEIKTDDAAIAGLVVSLMGNMNKVVIINGFVVKSFDSSYTVGELCFWFADYTSIKF